MEKNVILAIVLSLLVIIAWYLLFPPPQRPIQQERSTQEEPSGSEQPQTSVEQGQEISAPVEGILPLSDVSQRQLNEDAQEVVIDTPLFHVVLTTQGARILEWKIKAHKDLNGEPVELVSDDSRRLARLPLEVFTGNTSLDEELNFELYQSSVNIVELQSEDDPATISLSYVTSTGLRFTKELQFSSDSYQINIAMRFSDPSQVGNTLSVVWGPGVGANLGGMDRFEAGIVTKVGEKKPIRDAARKIDGVITHPNVYWGAIDQKYFTAAMFPSERNNMLSLNKISFQPQEGEEKVEPIRQLLIALSQPLKDGKCQLSLYAGPKEYTKLLEAYPGFEQLIDYGFFWFIARPLAGFMTLLYGYVKNYGIVIICLTILIKILFYPLTHKSFKSMQKMQDLQPKLNALKEKYRKDKQLQQQEMMKLYKQEGVNPMGGCFPMVLQIPVFFALYKTLSQSIELRGASFLWIPDLSEHEVVSFLQGTFLEPYVRPLVLLMGVSMFSQQSMTPTAADNKQAQMFKFMPILFTALFWNFPSGLVLYWFMNNILTIGQQYLIKKGGGKFFKTSKTQESEHEETTSSSRKRRKKGK